MNSWFSMSDVGSSMMRLCQCPRASVKLDVLIFPPALEPGRCQFGISDRVLDVLVPEFDLKRPRIPAGVRVVVNDSVPQHVPVFLNLEPGSLASSANELLKIAYGHRRATLGYEQERRPAFGIAVQAPQGAQLPAC